MKIYCVCRKHRNRTGGINLVAGKEISFIRTMTEIAYFLAKSSKEPKKRRY